MGNQTNLSGGAEEEHKQRKIGSTEGSGLAIGISLGIVLGVALGNIAVGLMLGGSCALILIALKRRNARLHRTVTGVFLAAILVTTMILLYKSLFLDKLN